MAEAYRIQDAAIARWSDDLVGWKIGYIAPDRRSPGEPDRLVGPIWSRGCHPSDGPPVEAGIFADGFAAVEAEFVVRLGQDLPAHAGAVDGRGGGRAGPAAAGRHRGGQQPDPRHQRPRPGRDRRRLRQQQRAAARSGARGRWPASSWPAPSTGSSWGRGRRRTCRADCTTVWPPPSTCSSERGHAVRAGTVFATGAITGIHAIRPGQHCRVEVRDRSSRDEGPSLELRTVDLARPS